MSLVTSLFLTDVVDGVIRVMRDGGVSDRVMVELDVMKS